MSLSNEALLEALDTVVSIPVVPFREGAIDYAGHGKNIDYLLSNNHLEGDRTRVISIAGTSLVHHISVGEQLRLMEATAAQISGRGIFISGVAPNPIADAEGLIAAQCRLSAPPDAFLLMPLTGVADPEGLYADYMALAERLGKLGARFLYYLRQPNQASVAVRLINDSPHFIGVKIGTSQDEVKPILSDVRDGAGIVIWGIGDRSTDPAEAGTRGHTSGINVAFARASDEINNAQRRGDWAAARAIEELVTPLEEIRFRNGRTYNYSAVVEAMHLSGFDDIEGGEGGPFNPRVPKAVAAEVESAIQPLLEFH
ncbi:MAG: dihydrodipicolinate synthase family protein [Candidatus Latescibacteria bacterium]|jgi:dihydrodipicolinate synthase/N-acetylneuraminate lyase|nr:dihydrodipicolinate synthase family protein [Candidatus Latescibacterota bacterium]MDP7447486.1 dihydrodipicolinate synthase family protein [Candidatus Latescibacterota bacterium]HJP34062.1 dihydrodipicolinate synthase family protein [Candidatus Latescibacterota bacterium]